MITHGQRQYARAARCSNVMKPVNGKHPRLRVTAITFILLLNEQKREKEIALKSLSPPCRKWILPNQRALYFYLYFYCTTNVHSL
jgi:hypothetical protein